MAKLKIKLDGKYLTREGRRVRIYCIDGSDNCVVHGAVLENCGWCIMCWDIHGTAFGVTSREWDDDIFPISQRKPLKKKK